MITALVQTLIENIPMLIDAALQLVIGLAQGLLAAIPVLIAAIPEIITSLITAILESIPLIITREVAAGALFLVEVCNNAFDAVPTWEDATAEVAAGLAHVFTNKVKTSIKWGVNIRAKIERNGAVGDCWISGIGGNIE